MPRYSDALNLVFSGMPGMVKEPKEHDLSSCTTTGPHVWVTRCNCGKEFVTETPSQGTELLKIHTKYALSAEYGKQPDKFPGYSMLDEHHGEQPAPASQTDHGSPLVDVEIIVMRDGKVLSGGVYGDVPLAVVEEAIAHVNDNAGGVGE